MRQHAAAIREQYGREGLLAAIDRALVAAGTDLEQLQPEDLVAIDQFHIGGQAATAETAAAAAIGPEDHVLDVGCGIGGPARSIAVSTGCRVTGLELTPAYYETAIALTERVGLADRISFRLGDALEQPFAASSFDVVWCQHINMNIAEKPVLYAEVARLLKPGGRLVLHEILAGPVGEVVFPVFWADDPSRSFLIEGVELRRLLDSLGYRITLWEDLSPAGVEFFTAVVRRLESEDAPPLGLATLVGESTPVKARNLLRNLEEERIRVVRAVATC